MALAKCTFIQESRMRENLTYGLTRGQGKQGFKATAPLSYSTVRFRYALSQRHAYLFKLPKNIFM